MVHYYIISYYYYTLLVLVVNVNNCPISSRSALSLRCNITLLSIQTLPAVLYGTLTWISSYQLIKGQL